MSQTLGATTHTIWRERYLRLSHRLVERAWSLPFVGERLATAERMSVPTQSRRILFLCKGNICRSAFAEAWARVFARGISGWEFRSAGLEGGQGAQPPDIAVKVAAEFEVDLTSHRSRIIGAADIAGADVIMVMEPHQQVEARRYVNGTGSPVALLGAFCDVVRPIIRDPYGHGESDYRECFRQIHEAVIRVVGRAVDPSLAKGI